jgi:hypothetical protein
MTGSPWEGALTYRTYFPAGSTKGATRETLGLFYPGNQVAHVLMTVYRPDAASRTFALSLAAGEKKAISLNGLAPGTGLATLVAADRQIVVDRVSWTADSLITDPSVARTARRWYFAAVPQHAPLNARLIFFNPHDAPVSIEVTIGRQTGGCCAADLHLSIPPLKQFEFQPGAPGMLDGPMSLMAADAVAVERVAEGPDHVTEIDIPGGVTTATQWYLPVVHSDKSGLVTIFNPGNLTVTARIQMSLDEGAGAWLQRSVPPFSEVTLPVARLTHLQLAAVSIESSAPVLAAALWYVKADQPAAYQGVDVAGNNWAIVTGLCDPVFVDTLEIQNPTTRRIRVTISLAGPKGTQRSWRIMLPPQSRYAKVINNMVAPGPAVILVRSSGPVVASHTLTGLVGSSTAAGALLL